MQARSRKDTKVISIEKRKLRAAQCKRCGTKIYPASLLRRHLMRHRVRQRWFSDELKKLQFTFARMRVIA